MATEPTNNQAAVVDRLMKETLLLNKEKNVMLKCLKSIAEMGVDKITPIETAKGITESIAQCIKTLKAIRQS